MNIPPYFAIHSVALASLAATIRAEYAVATDCERKSITAYRRLGEVLNEAKSQCPQGTWGQWVSDNCPFKLRQANNYRRLAKSAVTADLESVWRIIQSNAPPDDYAPADGEFSSAVQPRTALENSPPPQSPRLAPSAPKLLRPSSHPAPPLETSEPVSGDHEDPAPPPEISDPPSDPLDQIRSLSVTLLRSVNKLINGDTCEGRKLLAALMASGQVLRHNKSGMWKLQCLLGLPYLLGLASAPKKLPRDSAIKLRFNEISGGYLPHGVQIHREKKAYRSQKAVLDARPDAL